MFGSRVLLAEHDEALRASLHALLTAADYDVEIAADGQRALHLGLTREYEAVLLDRWLPAVDGLGVVGGLQRRGVGAPILLLSRSASSAEVVAGLDAGADDYVAVPFDAAELLARLRALRRNPLEQARRFTLGAVQLDLDAREVRDGAMTVRLSAREADLLGALAARPQQVFSRDDLLASVFTDADNPVIVDTYVCYVRRKLGHGAVHTIRGRGYRLGRPAPEPGGHTSGGDPAPVGQGPARPTMRAPAGAPGRS